MYKLSKTHGNDILHLKQQLFRDSIKELKALHMKSDCITFCNIKKTTRKQCLAFSFEPQVFKFKSFYWKHHFIWCRRFSRFTECNWNTENNSKISNGKHKRVNNENRSYFYSDVKQKKSPPPPPFHLYPKSFKIKRQSVFNG